MTKYRLEPLANNVEEMFIGPFGSSLKNDCFVDESEAYCMVYEQKHAIQKNMNLETRYVNEQKYNELKRFNVKGGDIIVSCRGTIGETYVVPDDAPLGIMHPSIMKIRLKEGVYDKHYFDLLLKSRLKKHESEANGSGVKMAISATALGKELFPVPSIAEQNEISKILYTVSDIIAKRTEELNKFDNLIKARFVEMFGNPLDKSKVNSIFTDCVVFNPKKSELDDLDIDVSFVPMECVGVDGSFTIRETGKASDYYKGYTYFKDGDVLLAKITPCFENGKVAIASGCENGIGFGTTEFHVSRPKPGVSNSYWIKYMLKNDLVHSLATINMTGSAGQKRIQTPFFEKLKVYLPPIELQNQFAEFVKQVDKSKVVKEMRNK